VVRLHLANYIFTCLCDSLPSFCFAYLCYVTCCVLPFLRLCFTHCRAAAEFFVSFHRYFPFLVFVLFQDSTSSIRISAPNFLFQSYPIRPDNLAQNLICSLLSQYQRMTLCFISRRCLSSTFYHLTRLFVALDSSRLLSWKFCFLNFGCLQHFSLTRLFDALDPSRLFSSWSLCFISQLWLSSTFII
jgi:hypothetical protein